MNLKHGHAPSFCPDHNKRKYRSRNQALRAGETKYGVRTNAYRCPVCSHWHLTRRGTQLDERRDTTAEAADALVEALGIGGAE